MESLQRLIAWYLGLEAPRPGEGTSWRFDCHLPEPYWLVLILSVAAVVFVTAIYRRDGENLQWQVQVFLIGLRLGLLGVILGILTEPSLTIERTGLPVVAVMIDTSASMSLQDKYPPNSNASRMIEDISNSTTGGADRLRIVQQILTRNGGRFLSEIQHGHEMRLYRFAESASLLGSEESHTDPDKFAMSQSTQGWLAKSVQEVLSLTADGDQTRPAPSAKKVISDLRGAPPAAIVMFTDGIASVFEADKLSTIADFVRRKGVQLHIVGIGSETAVKDLSLNDTQVDEVAFVGDPMLFKAKIRGSGYSGQKINVQLRREGDTSILSQREFVAPGDGDSTAVELTYSSVAAGEFDYVLEIADLPDETNRTNNSETRHVSIRDEKTRVLLVDGSPRYEFRFLKQLLERDKSIDMKNLLQEADNGYVKEDRTAIEHFPVKKDELAHFDVVIFGDVDPEPLRTSGLDNLRDFVREKGGSLIFIAGTRFNPRAFSGTPLESLIPFELGGTRIPTEGVVENFHPHLTIEGQKGSSLFRLGNSESESLKIWEGLPNLTWMLEISKSKPGSHILAEHPTSHGTNGRFPLIIMQQIGAGKVLYHATDESWRWRFRSGDLYYGRYWIQAIRSLSRSRMVGKDRTAELTADQMVYQRGQSATIRVKFADEKFIPADTHGVTVTFERKGEGRHSLQLSRMSDLPTAFEGQFSQLLEGVYHGWVSQPAFNEAPPSVDFRVEIPKNELLRREMDRADLQLAATTSHGKFYALNDVDSLPSEIPRGTQVPIETDDPIPLWNRWEVMVIVSTLLAAEWLMRKRFKLI